MRRISKTYSTLLAVTISLLLTPTIASAQMPDVPNAEQLPITNEMIVAYYGRPGVKSLGVLGQYSLDEIIPIIKEKANAYKKASGNNNVVPGFDIIYGLASAEPGRKHDYIIPLSSEKLMPYINAAQEHGFLVFIDLQLGKMAPAEAIRPVLKYLKYDNVHLAIDPEFEVYGLDERPGKVIGHIYGEDVNKVQAIMADYMKQHEIKEKKILIVHMFRESMVKNKKAVKKHDDIDLIMNLDGHGSPKLKVDIYNAIYTHRRSQKVAGGFKLFFNEDKPALMTPHEVLGLKPVGGTQIKDMPKYINYQ